MVSAAPGARERARAETTEAIKQAARSRLALDGADLSLRAVARDVGMVSSAVYRYFASRDELLTALILDGYDSMGEAVERAEAALPRRDLAGRWLAMGRATRQWSRERPHEYALLYGSPVPGYAAPQDTVAPAVRVLLVAAAIVREGVEREGVEREGVERKVAVATSDRLPRAVRADLGNVSAYPGFGGVPPSVLARLMAAWAQLFGMISFELFGRYTGAVEHLDEYFDFETRRLGRWVGGW